MLRFTVLPSLARIFVALLAFSGFDAARATVVVSANLTQTAAGSPNSYSITLNNASTAGEAVSTFWFSWIPGQDYMSVSPTNITAPAGWTFSITHGGSSDGYAIRFTTSTAALAASSSLTGFTFQSTNSISQLEGNSVFYSTTPVLTSVAFTGGGAVETTFLPTFLTAQTITFPSLNPEQVVGLPITLGATASSGLDVTYQITTGSGIANLSGLNNNILNFTGTGAVTIEAEQAGNTTYAAATPVSQSITVIAASYTYVDLGVPTSLSGNTTAYSYATGIDDAGIIVGTAGSSSSAPTAILDANGTMTDLGAQLAGGSFDYSYGYGINQAGDVVGSFYESSPGTLQAFLDADGVFTNLGALSANTQSTAVAINDSDQVVGDSLDASGVEHAFVYSGGTMQDLGFLDTGAGAFSAALGINDAGEVVGDSEVDTSAFGGYIPHGFYTTSYTTNTGLVDMGFELVPLGGGSFEEYKEIAYAADSSGTIVGGTCPVCPGEAFTETNGVYTYLGVLSGDDSSYATAKNDSGQIVGACFVEEGSSSYSNQTYIPGATKFGTDRRGFVYKGGTMYDLNAITAYIPSGWMIVEAAAINHSGQIVGYALQGTIEQTTSITHAFLLNPVTPAATVTLTNLTATYNGTAQTPTVTTTPTLATTLTFVDDLGKITTRAPSAIGTYTVTAAINDPNYHGSTTGSFTISAPSQTIVFPPIANQVPGAPAFTLNATASSGLPVTYTYVSGPATLSGTNNSIVTVTGTGTVVLQASQAGNGTYPAATNTTQSFTVAEPVSFTGIAETTTNGDGVPDLLKYAFDIALGDYMTPGDRAALPTAGSMTTTSDGTTTTYLTVTYREYALATGVAINPQISTDLVNWSTPSNLTTSQISVDPNTGDPIMQAQVPVTATNQFIRVSVTQQ